MSTLAILSQGGITSGSVNISTQDGIFIVPKGVKKIYVRCDFDNSNFYARVTAGSALTTEQEIEVISDDNSQSCYWIFYCRLNSNSKSYYSDGITVGSMDYSSYITIYWSNAINNYTGGAADLTA